MQLSIVKTESRALCRSTLCIIIGSRAFHASRALYITNSPLFTLPAYLQATPDKPVSANMTAPLLNHCVNCKVIVNVFCFVIVYHTSWQINQNANNARPNLKLTKQFLKLASPAIRQSIVYNRNNEINQITTATSHRTSVDKVDNYRLQKTKIIGSIKTTVYNKLSFPQVWRESLLTSNRAHLWVLRCNQSEHETHYNSLTSQMIGRQHV